MLAIHACASFLQYRNPGKRSAASSAALEGRGDLSGVFTPAHLCHPLHLWTPPSPAGLPRRPQPSGKASKQYLENA
jgi:hypothetical protein